MQDRPGAARPVASRAAAGRPARWVLVALGGGELRTYLLEAGAERLIGRDLDCDIVLEHHRVSRRHARLRVASGGDALAIEDLGSRNGTRIGERLPPRQPCPVRAGDAIAIGPFTLTAVRGTLRAQRLIAVEDPVASAPSPELLAVARGAENVLVRGEAGAARALAEALHRLSGRGGRMVSIDCAAAGAGAGPGTGPGPGPGSIEGALEAAGDDTVLLEEIGALPAPLQVELLQVVERREAAAGAGPGGPRLVCATQRDLFALIEAAAFRLDLYHRLAGATLAIRQLREGLGPDEAAERRRILDALDRSGGSQVRAAKLLGISRGALATKLSSYRISRPPRTRP